MHDRLRIVAASADDILLTKAFTGLQTNMLRPSIEAAGLDPDDLPLRGAIDIGKDIDIGARENRPKPFRDEKILDMGLARFFHDTEDNILALMSEVREPRL